MSNLNFNPRKNGYIALWAVLTICTFTQCGKMSDPTSIPMPEASGGGLELERIDEIDECNVPQASEAQGERQHEGSLFTLALRDAANMREVRVVCDAAGELQAYDTDNKPLRISGEVKQVPPHRALEFKQQLAQDGYVAMQGKEVTIHHRMRGGMFVPLMAVAAASGYHATQQNGRRDSYPESDPEYQRWYENKTRNMSFHEEGYFDGPREWEKEQEAKQRQAREAREAEERSRRAREEEENRRRAQAEEERSRREEEEKQRRAAEKQRKAEEQRQRDKAENEELRQRDKEEYERQREADKKAYEEQREADKKAYEEQRKQDKEKNAKLQQDLDEMKAKVEKMMAKLFEQQQAEAARKAKEADKEDKADEEDEEDEQWEVLSGS